MRLIDADSVKRGIAELKQSPWYNEKNLDHFHIRKEAVEIVEQLCIDKEPTIDAVPVVRGEWVDEGKKVKWDEKNPGCPSGSCECSICGDWLTASDEYPARGLYCPNCGAKMKGEADVKR